MPEMDSKSARRAPTACAHWALFLDLDGTLLDFAATPDAVRASPALIVDLSRLYDVLGGAIAIVSGRTIAGIDQLLSPLRLPAAGQHGAELRLAPSHAIEIAATMTVARHWHDRLAALVRNHPGVLIENKGLAIAVHFRNAHPAETPIRDTLVDLVLEDPRFVLQGGKFVWELRPRNHDKGTALRRLMSVEPFAGRIPVVLGDDSTDEDAFAAARALGGQVIRIGNSGHGDATLADPAAAREWLHSCAEALTAAALPA